MNVEELLDKFCLRPSTESIPAIRSLLGEQAEKEQHAQGAGDTELMKLCCVQLFANEDVSDSLPIWKAKSSSMDADASIDVQLLCGGGLLETKEYLKQHPAPGAAHALARIEACEASGDFDGFSVEETLAFYEDYYAEE
ncbi:uncharacterized protein sS8_0907 [Methylocaldum marinum]|uniref:Uncharacterized protein n=1 Tax=Methylocaldum marinum TaxID=1432792 RepID=A0A250KMX0_9GAMM|nr:hypothetical protein [Methylocaldum marinum]BBA32872.1 uncharacterized protein sS8_0907 [Methylocaldum marinum]